MKLCLSYTYISALSKNVKSIVSWEQPRSMSKFKIPFSRKHTHNLSNHTTPCNTTQCHTTPCHAMPHHTMPCHTMPFHATPYHVMPCHTMPCHTMPCHATPHHAMIMRKISCRMKQLWLYNALGQDVRTQKRLQKQAFVTNG